MRKRRLDYVSAPDGLHIYTFEEIDKQMYGKVDSIELSLKPVTLPETQPDVWRAFDREKTGPTRLPAAYYEDLLTKRFCIPLEPTESARRIHQVLDKRTQRLFPWTPRRDETDGDISDTDRNSTSRSAASVASVSARGLGWTYGGSWTTGGDGEVERALSEEEAARGYVLRPMRKEFAELAQLSISLRRERRELLEKATVLDTTRREALSLMVLCRWKAFGAGNRQTKRLIRLRQLMASSLTMRGTRHGPLQERELGMRCDVALSPTMGGKGGALPRVGGADVDWTADGGWHPMRLVLESAIGRKCWAAFLEALRARLQRENFSRNYRNAAASGWELVHSNLRLLRIRALEEATEQWLRINAWEKSPPEKRTEIRALQAYASLIEMPGCIVKDVVRRKAKVNDKGKGGGGGGSSSSNISGDEHSAKAALMPPLYSSDLKDIISAKVMGLMQTEYSYATSIAEIADSESSSGGQGLLQLVSTQSFQDRSRRVGQSHLTQGVSLEENRDEEEQIDSTLRKIGDEVAVEKCVAAAAGVQRSGSEDKTSTGVVGTLVKRKAVSRFVFQPAKVFLEERLIRAGWAGFAESRLFRIWLRTLEHQKELHDAAVSAVRLSVATIHQAHSGASQLGSSRGTAIGQNADLTTVYSLGAEEPLSHSQDISQGTRTEETMQKSSMDLKISARGDMRAIIMAEESSLKAYLLLLYEDNPQMTCDGNGSSDGDRSKSLENVFLSASSSSSDSSFAQAQAKGQDVLRNIKRRCQTGALEDRDGALLLGEPWARRPYEWQKAYLDGAAFCFGSLASITSTDSDDGDRIKTKDVYTDAQSSMFGNVTSVATLVSAIATAKRSSPACRALSLGALAALVRTNSAAALWVITSERRLIQLLAAALHRAAVEAHLAAGEASSAAAQMQLMPEHGIDPSSKPGYEELKKEAVAKVKEERKRGRQENRTKSSDSERSDGPGLEGRGYLYRELDLPTDSAGQESLTIQALSFARELARASWAAHAVLEPVVYYVVRVIIEMRRALDEVAFMLGKTGGGLGSSWVAAAKKTGVLLPADPRFVDDDFTKSENDEDDDAWIEEEIEIENEAREQAAGEPHAIELEQGTAKKVSTRRRKRTSEDRAISAEADELLFTGAYGDMRKAMRRQEAKLQLIFDRCLSLLQTLATSSTRQQASHIVRFGRYFPENNKASLFSVIHAQDAAEQKLKLDMNGAASRALAAVAKPAIRAQQMLRGFLTSKNSSETSDKHGNQGGGDGRSNGEILGWRESAATLRTKEVERLRLRRLRQVNLLNDQLCSTVPRLLKFEELMAVTRKRVWDPRLADFAVEPLDEAEYQSATVLASVFRRRRGKQQAYDYDLLVDEVVARDHKEQGWDATLDEDGQHAVMVVLVAEIWRLLSSLYPSSNPQSLLEPLSKLLGARVSESRDEPSNIDESNNGSVIGEQNDDEEEEEVDEDGDKKQEAAWAEVFNTTGSHSKQKLSKVELLQGLRRACARNPKLAWVLYRGLNLPLLSGNKFDEAIRQEEESIPEQQSASLQSPTGAANEPYMRERFESLFDAMDISDNQTISLSELLKYLKVLKKAAKRLKKRPRAGVAELGISQGKLDNSEPFGTRLLNVLVAVVRLARSPQGRNALMRSRFTYDERVLHEKDLRETRAFERSRKQQDSRRNPRPSNAQAVRAESDDSNANGPQFDAIGGRTFCALLLDLLRFTDALMAPLLDLGQYHRVRIPTKEEVRSANEAKIAAVRDIEANAIAQKTKIEREAVEAAEAAAATALKLAIAERQAQEEDEALAKAEAAAEADAEAMQELHLWLTKKKFIADAITDALPTCDSLTALAFVTRRQLDEYCSDFMRNPDKARLLKEIANTKSLQRLKRLKEKADEQIAFEQSMEASECLAMNSEDRDAAMELEAGESLGNDDIADDISSEGTLEYDSDDNRIDVKARRREETARREKEAQAAEAIQRDQEARDAKYRGVSLIEVMKREGVEGANLSASKDGDAFDKYAQSHSWQHNIDAFGVPVDTADSKEGTDRNKSMTVDADTRKMSAQVHHRRSLPKPPNMPPHLRLWGVAMGAQLRLYATELLALVCLEKGGGDMILDTPGAVQTLDMHAHCDPTCGMVFAAAAHVLESDSAAAAANTASEAAAAVKQMNNLTAVNGKFSSPQNENDDDDDDDDDDEPWGVESVVKRGGRRGNKSISAAGKHVKAPIHPASSKADKDSEERQRAARRSKRYDRAREKGAKVAALARARSSNSSSFDVTSLFVEVEELDYDRDGSGRKRDHLDRRRLEQKRRAQHIEGGWDNYKYGPAFDEQGMSLDLNNPSLVAATIRGRRGERYSDGGSAAPLSGTEKLEEGKSGGLEEEDHGKASLRSIEIAQFSIDSAHAVAEAVEEAAESEERELEKEIMDARLEADKAIEAVKSARVEVAPASNTTAMPGDTQFDSYESNDTGDSLPGATRNQNSRGESSGSGAELRVEIAALEKKAAQAVAEAEALEKDSKVANEKSEVPASLQAALAALRALERRDGSSALAVRGMMLHNGEAQLDVSHDGEADLTRSWRQGHASESSPLQYAPSDFLPTEQLSILQQQSSSHLQQNDGYKNESSVALQGHPGTVLVASRMNIGRIAQLEDWIRRCAQAAVQGALEASKLRREFGANALSLELASGEHDIDTSDLELALMSNNAPPKFEMHASARLQGDAEVEGDGSIPREPKVSPVPSAADLKTALLASSSDTAAAGASLVNVDEAYLPPDLPCPPPRAVALAAAEEWARAALVATPDRAAKVSAGASVARADDPLVAWRSSFDCAVALASLAGKPNARFPKSNRLAYPGDASSVPRAAFMALSRAAVSRAEDEEDREHCSSTIRDFDFKRYEHRYNEEKARKAMQLAMRKSLRGSGTGRISVPAATPSSKKHIPGGTIQLLSKFSWYQGPAGCGGGKRAEGTGARLPISDAHAMLVRLVEDVLDRLREHHGRRAVIYQAAVGLGIVHAQRVARSYVCRATVGRAMQRRLLGFAAPWAARLTLQACGRGYLARKEVGMLAEFPRLPRGNALRLVAAAAMGEPPPREPKFLTEGDLKTASLLLGQMAGSRSVATSAASGAPSTVSAKKNRYEVARQLREGIVEKAASSSTAFADQGNGLLNVTSTVDAASSMVGGAASPRKRVRRRKRPNEETPASKANTTARGGTRRIGVDGTPVAELGEDSSLLLLVSSTARETVRKTGDGNSGLRFVRSASVDTDDGSKNNHRSESGLLETTPLMDQRKAPTRDGTAVPIQQPSSNVNLPAVPTMAVVVGRNDGGIHRAVWEQRCPANAFDFMGPHGALAVSLSRRFSGPRQRLAAMHLLISAILIQSIGRVFIAKRTAAIMRFASYEYCIQRIQRCFRVFLAKRCLRELAREAALQSHLAASMIQALIRGVLTRMALVQFRRAQAALKLTRVARGMIARVRVLKKRVRQEAARNQAARRERRKMTKQATAQNRERRRLAEEERLRRLQASIDEKRQRTDALIEARRKAQVRVKELQRIAKLQEKRLDEDLKGQKSGNPARWSKNTRELVLQNGPGAGARRSQRKKRRRRQELERARAKALEEGYDDNDKEVLLIDRELGDITEESGRSDIDEDEESFYDEGGYEFYYDRAGEKVYRTSASEYTGSETEDGTDTDREYDSMSDRGRSRENIRRSDSRESDEALKPGSRNRERREGSTQKDSRRVAKKKTSRDFVKGMAPAIDKGAIESRSKSRGGRVGEADTDKNQNDEHGTSNINNINNDSEGRGRRVDDSFVNGTSTRFPPVSGRSRDVGRGTGDAINRRSVSISSEGLGGGIGEDRYYEGQTGQFDEEFEYEIVQPVSVDSGEQNEQQQERQRDAETGEWLEMENRMWVDSISVLPPQAPSELRAAAAAALANEEEAEAALAKAKERRARKARAKKLRSLHSRQGADVDDLEGDFKRKPRSRAELKLQHQLDRMDFIKRATGRDGKPLLHDDKLTRQVVELVEARDKFQAHLLMLLEAEESEEARRRREIKRAATNDEARDWVAKRHARERAEARLHIERVKHDNEMALVAKMASAGLVR